MCDPMNTSRRLKLCMLCVIQLYYMGVRGAERLPEQVHLGRETPREPGENARIECELKKRLVKAYEIHYTVYMIVDPSRPTQR